MQQKNGQIFYFFNFFEIFWGKIMGKTKRVLQIKHLDPEILRQVDIYEAEHNNMKHAELFTKAFLALKAAENN